MYDFLAILTLLALIGMLVGIGSICMGARGPWKKEPVEQLPIDDWEQGQTAVLRSGGPTMYVMEYHAASKEVLCWWANAEYETDSGWFPSASLIRVHQSAYDASCED